MMLSMILWAGLLICAVPTLVFCVQIASAWFLVQRSARTDPSAGDSDVPATVILVPAHNEERVIANTLNALKGLSPRVVVLVIADNCSDQTASIAREYGVKVVERTSDTLRGKGYALQHGLDHIRSAPPEVVIVLDADCTTTAADMHRLSHRCRSLSEPVQGIYLMHAPEGGGIGSKVAAFAWLVKTFVRPSGWRMWGNTSQLMGSGFALPWKIAGTLDLASGHIVEDMKLTLDLASQLHAPRFVTDVNVASTFPSADRAQATQRKRWEHGHLSMVMKDVPRAIHRAVRDGNRQLLSVALDLLVPPLSLLVMLLGTLGMLSVYQAVIQVPTFAGMAILGLVMSLIVAVGLAWFQWGRSVLSAWELAAIPVFMLRKLGVYATFFLRREKNWRRTDRD